MGNYQHTGDYAHGKPVYTHSADTSAQLQYVNDVTHHWSGWVVGEGMGNLSHDDCLLLVAEALRSTTEATKELGEVVYEK